MVITLAGLLAKIKTDLRIDYNDLDDDITDNITAAMIDLQTGGAAAEIHDADDDVPGKWCNIDELTLRGIKLFCRWQYNYDGSGDKYEKAYNSLKIVLAVDTDHRETAAE